MKIPEIPGVCLNDVISGDFNNCIHFITHTLEQEIVSLPDDWTTKIYTSQFICNIILAYRKNGPSKYFHRLKPGINLITLNNGRSLKIQYFVTSAISGNLMMAFEYEEIKILYGGVFSDLNQLLFNDDFHKFIESGGVNCLYIDNYYWRCENNGSSNDTIQIIQRIINLHPSSTFLMNVPILGYEELILNVAQQIEERVFISGLNLYVFKDLKLEKLFVTNRDSAKILVGRAVKSLDEIKQDYGHKLINIRITDAYRDCFENNLEYHRYGLYEVKWSPHPTRIQLEKFIQLVKPKIIRTMYEMLKYDDSPIEYIKSIPRTKSVADFSMTTGSCFNANIVTAGDSNRESLIEISDTESNCRFILSCQSSVSDAHSGRLLDADTKKILPNVPVVESIDLTNDQQNLVDLENKLSQLNKTNESSVQIPNKNDEVNKLKLSTDYKLLYNRVKRKSVNTQNAKNTMKKLNHSPNVSGTVDLVYKQPKFNFNVNNNKIIYLDSDDEEL